MAQYTLVQEQLEESGPGCEDEESAFFDDEHLLEKSIILQNQKPFYRQYLRSIALHSLCFSLNLVILASTMRWAHGDCPFGVYGPDLVYTPAREAIAYQTQRWDSTSVFFINGSVNPDRLHKCFGPPSLESDQAWTELIQYQNIRLTYDELGEYQDKEGLVELADGSGYYATLSTYHSIHCIKRLHHLMYFEHYYPNVTDQEAIFIKHHGQHCLNILLQAAQCTPDLSILPMQWGATTRIPIGLDEGHHQCMQWDKIDSWMKQRSLDVFAPGVIVHPTLGDAYPGGKGDNIGIAVGHLLSDHE